MRTALEPIQSAAEQQILTPWGFSEAGKHQGSGETHQDLAAVKGDAEETWALPEQLWLASPIISSPGSASDSDKQIGHGTSARE